MTDLPRRDFIAGAAVTVATTALPSSIAVPATPVGGEAINVVAKQHTARFGVNLAGAEYKISTPAFPTEAQVAYYHGKGINLVRLPMRWESMQPRLNGPLDPIWLAKLKTTLGFMAAREMDCLVDLHNYGRYGKWILGSPELPIATLKDFWLRMATELKGYPHIYGFDLMNEPHDLGDPAIWPAAAQAAVEGIRSVDTRVAVVIEGDQWSAPSTFAVGGLNANFSVNDAGNNWIASAHTYWDGHGGAYKEPTIKNATPMVGIIQTLPFFEYLARQGIRGVIGEFGVPGRDPISGPAWMTSMHFFTQACQAFGVDAIYWAGGRWNLIGLGGPDYNQPLYVLSCEPTGIFKPPLVDSPQVVMLTQDQHKPVDVPLISAAATFSIAPTVNKGQVVGTVQAANNPTAFGILGGDPHSEFSISNTGDIRLNSPAQARILPRQYTLVVVAFNAGGMSGLANVTINVK